MHTHKISLQTASLDDICYSARAAAFQAIKPDSLTRNAFDLLGHLSGDVNLGMALMVPFFYRVFIVKFGLRVRLMVASFLAPGRVMMMMMMMMIMMMMMMMRRRRRSNKEEKQEQGDKEKEQE